MKLFVLLLLSYLIYDVRCAKILGIFPAPANSHYILGSSLMNALAEKGHDVTMISPFENKNPPKNGSFRDIILTGLREQQTVIGHKSSLFDRESANPISTVIGMNQVIMKLTEMTLNHTNVQTLLNSNETFDVVIVLQLLNVAHMGFAAHFNAPLIVFSSVGACDWVNSLVANPSPLSYIPEMLLSYSSDMTFFQRFINSFMYTFFKIYNYYYVYPKHEKLLQKYFPNAPGLYDLYYNASLVLLNSHPSISQPVPLVPNMIEIGGFHTKPPKKLPEDLQEFLDSAEEGVIYFSMGSNLQSTQLPIEKREAILKAFSKLKQKVLWKWEDDELPGKPDNVKTGKWLPQQDILAHPNVKLFITHGGLLSTTETIYHGVPTLTIPIFGDQKTNAARAVINGYALILPFSDISEEKLSEKLEELLSNPKYRNMAQFRSRVFHDQQIKPIDKAIYWVEYVARHGRTDHLKVAGLKLPWYKYHLLDVIIFAFLIVITITIVLFLLIKKLYFGKKEKLKKN